MGNKIVEGLAAISTSNLEITNDILILQFKVVNVYFVGNKSDDWVIVDTGLENSFDHIIKTAKERFGEHAAPKAIVLTHGHFDHVGSLKKLLDYYNAPVYIHELEMPYVTGEKDYATADPSVDSGIIAKMSPTFPHTSINVKDKVIPLPQDGTVPYMNDWKWIHTPGHTDGHISLFREKDGALIVGDAFCTVKQESLISVITQDEELSGPPKYFTTDWETAEQSVEKLKSLKPRLIIPSHGKPLKDDEAIKFLETLSNNFKQIALPEQ